MSVRKRILLVAPNPDLLHSRILESAGYEVASASSVSEARRVWKLGNYALVIITANPESAEALEFCEELKLAYPPQSVALLTGWYTYLPKDSCPDAAISRVDGPEHFLARVGELIATA